MHATTLHCTVWEHAVPLLYETQEDYHHPSSKYLSKWQTLFGPLQPKKIIHFPYGHVGYYRFSSFSSFHVRPRTSIGGEVCLLVSLSFTHSRKMDDFDVFLNSCTFLPHAFPLTINELHSTVHSFIHSFIYSKRSFIKITIILNQRGVHIGRNLAMFLWNPPQPALFLLFLLTTLSTLRCWHPASLLLSED